MLQALSEKLVGDIRPAYAAAFSLLAAALLLAGPLSFVVGLPLVPFALEGAFRLLLRLSYGAHYLHRIRPYLFKDHPLYGYCLRENVDSVAVPFLLFEKYFFRPGTGVLLDPEKNRRERLRFKTNSKGFRGPEFAAEKRPGAVRVICLGDSTTIGHGVAEGEPWPAQLEKSLVALGVPAESINAGVNGWDSYQELLRLKHELVHYQPDVLVLHQGWNEEFNFSSLGLGKNYRPKVARGYWDKYFLYTNPSDIRPRRFLSLILLLRMYVKDYFLRTRMAFASPERWLTLTRAEYLRDWYDNLVEIAALCEERSIRLYLVDYPCLVGMQDAPQERKDLIAGTRLNAVHAAYQACSKARVEACLRVAGEFVPLVDGAAVFKRLDHRRRRELFSDEIHLTPEGEAMLGACVAEAVAADLRAGSAARGLKPGKDLAEMRRARERVGVNSAAIAAEIDRVRAELLAAARAKT